jgi:hydrophobe/amphiphile efflux-3 (HAE3) family protein
MDAFWHFCADSIRKWHVWLLALAVAATVGLAFGIPRLHFKTSNDTIVPSDSETYRENVRYESQFGGEPLLVLFTGDNILELFTGANRAELAALESDLENSGLYHSVFGPLGLVEFAKDQVPVGAELAVARQDRAAEAAREIAAQQGASPDEQERAAEEARRALAADFIEQQAADAERFAAAGEPSLDNPAFVEFLVLDETGGIRPEFQGVFPDLQHALMVVRLNGNMSIDQQGDASGLAIDIVREHQFEGFEVLPTGPPILLKEINDTMRESMLTMAALASFIMITVLFLVFRARWRLLSLGVVLIGSIWAFGLMGFLGISLTMVTISGLPILIGLGIDFAIQMHSRFEEESERTGSSLAGLTSSFAHVVPALAIAVVAAAVGFMALHISRVPMIRDFGSMLAVGITILAVAGVLLPASLLFWRDKTRGQTPQPAPTGRLQVERLVKALTSSTDRRLLPVVAIGVAFILIGLVADRQITIQTDPEKFVPQDSPVLTDLRAIREVAGSSNQMGIMVEADDVLDQEVLDWMDTFVDEQVAMHPNELKSAESISSIVGRIVGGRPETPDVEAVLAIAPDSVRNTFVSEDRKQAHIIFAIGPISLDEQQQLLTDMEEGLNAPPGVSAEPVGLAVIGIQAVDALSANRTLMVYVALGAVLIWLLLAYRNIVKTVLPLLPVLIALGGSSVAIYALGIELNPLTAVSGPLIIATCTEFSVLIMARYFEERERGRTPREAIDMASARIGRAITVAGLTTIGGFGVLAFSRFPLLETFGIVTALNVGIALFSALIVLPPLLIWADEEADLMRVSEHPQPAK